MLPGMGYLIAVLLWIGIVALAASMARKRYRDPFAWGAWAAFFGVFVLVALLLAGPSKEGRLRAIREEETIRLETRKGLGL